MTNTLALYSEPGAREALASWYNAALTHISTPFKTGHIATRHGETHLITSGDPGAERAVMFLHGLNTSAPVWTPQLNDGTLRQYALYAPDIVGLAGLSAENRLRYRDWSYAEWLVDVLDALELEKTVLVTASGAAHFALKTSAYSPERVAGLFLCSPVGLTRMRLPYDVFRLPPLMWLANRVIAERNAHHPGVPSQPFAGTDDERDYLVNRTFKKLHPPSPLSETILERIIAPTAILLGEEDPLLNDKRVRWRAERSIHALHSVEVLPGVGHNLNRDAPEAVNKRLLVFLEAVIKTS